MKRIMFGLAVVVLTLCAVIVLLGYGAMTLYGDTGQFGDQRYHTVLLAPVTDKNWIMPLDPVCGKGCRTETYPPCNWPFLDPIRCWILPRVVPTRGRVEYQNSGVRILVTAADLKWPDDRRNGVWDSSTKISLDGKVLLQVIVWVKSPATQIDLSHIHVVEPCGPGVGKSKDGSVLLQYVPYKWFRIRPGGTLDTPFPRDYYYGALLLHADPSRIEKCTLSFRDAVKSASGRIIPDITLHAVPIAYYRLVT